MQLPVIRKSWLHVLSSRSVACSSSYRRGNPLHLMLTRDQRQTGNAPASCQAAAGAVFQPQPPRRRSPVCTGCRYRYAVIKNLKRCFAGYQVWLCVLPQPLAVGVVVLLVTVLLVCHAVLAGHVSDLPAESVSAADERLCKVHRQQQQRNCKGASVQGSQQQRSSSYKQVEDAKSVQT